jgi:uncharacterized protein (DUF58 family)
VSPTPRAAALVTAVALAALVVPVPIAALGLVALVAAAVVDALAVRRPPEVVRTAPGFLSRGVPAPVRIALARPLPGRVRVRQPAPPDLSFQPAEADGRLEATVVARRRGRHVLPAPATRVDGPLGLGRWYHRPGEESEIVVYPDLAAAFRLALAVRQGRFRDPGRARRGPLGLGTDFESVRDYVPDDDVRQVNWRATARLGRPMSNQYRVEQDRDVVCVVDTGRLMAAPLADRTRLDAAVDAVAAIAVVADELGDRCGVIAFDDAVRRDLVPRRRGARAAIQAVYDLEPTPVESDYELAFRRVGGAKRSLVLVLTDLLEESAARPLVDAVPLLVRRHAVVVASAADTDLAEAVRREPQAPLDVYAASVALDVLAARARVTAQLRHTGADVLEAPPERLAAACVGAYLRAKARARV